MNLYEIANISNLTLMKNAIAKGLKVGYCDIETSPELSLNYGVKKVFIGHDNIVVPTKITSVVILAEGSKKAKKFKWEHPGKLEVSAAPDGSVRYTGGGDDSKFLRKVKEELNKFDIIIMQNGDRFDAPLLQDRLCDLKLPPLRNLITLDTLKLSRRSFKRSHHSLDSQSKRFVGGGKDKQDMADAIAVFLGHKQTEEERLAYNVKDVFLTQKIFWRQLDYYNLPQTFINLLLLYLKEQKPYCVKCAARRQKRFEVEQTMVYFKSGGKGKRYQCKRCSHHWPIPKVL